jgi:hypothetical protein
VAKVKIIKSLLEEIIRKFGGKAHEIIDLLETLEKDPKKGKPLGNVGGMIIKEIRYEGYRFYFITDGYKIKVLSNDELSDLLIKFVRMSDKKEQQKVIDEIKKILRAIGETGFDV